MFCIKNKNKRKKIKNYLPQAIIPKRIQPTIGIIINIPHHPGFPTFSAVFQYKYTIPMPTKIPPAKGITATNIPKVHQPEIPTICVNRYMFAMGINASYPFLVPVFLAIAIKANAV